MIISGKTLKKNNWFTTDGPANRPTNGPTDRPSHRGARTHLRTSIKTAQRDQSRNVWTKRCLEWQTMNVIYRDRKLFLPHFRISACCRRYYLNCSQKSFFYHHFSMSYLVGKLQSHFDPFQKKTLYHCVGILITIPNM